MAWIEFDVTSGSTARHHARDELRALAHRRDVVERGLRCCPVQDGAAQQADATVDLYPEGLRAYFALGHAELARGR